MTLICGSGACGALGSAGVTSWLTLWVTARKMNESVMAGGAVSTFTLQITFLSHWTGFFFFFFLNEATIIPWENWENV